MLLSFFRREKVEGDFLFLRSGGIKETFYGKELLGKYWPKSILSMGLRKIF